VERVEEERLPASRRRHDEVALNALLAEVGITEVSISGLDLVLAVEVLQGRLGDVDAPAEINEKSFQGSILN
jgi:hypothetical protein